MEKYIIFYNMHTINIQTILFLIGNQELNITFSNQV